MSSGVCGMQKQYKWHRVNKSHPCRVCGHSDWCTESEIGSCCMRSKNDRPLKNGGYLHKTGEPVSGVRIEREAPAKRTSDELSILASEYQNTISTQQKERLAAELGVTVASLECLGVGWDGEAFTFPMQDAEFRVVGIRRRLPNGRKLSVKGGSEGCFIPLGVPGDLADQILVCEGPSDTAALLDMRYEAIGRPSCAGGVEIVAKISGEMNVVIVADDDEPGIRGAKALAAKLWNRKRDVKIIKPMRGKDAREWCRYANREVVDSVIANCIEYSP